jgi:GTP-binding protein
MSLSASNTDNPDTFLVSGRGCTCPYRREHAPEIRNGGFQPEVILRHIDGQKQEPIEYLVVDVPAERRNIMKDGPRKGEMAPCISLAKSFASVLVRHED